MPSTVSQSVVRRHGPGEGTGNDTSDCGGEVWSCVEVSGRLVSDCGDAVFPVSACCPELGTPINPVPANGMIGCPGGGCWGATEACSTLATGTPCRWWPATARKMATTIPITISAAPSRPTNRMKYRSMNGHCSSLMTRSFLNSRPWKTLY